MLMGQDSTKTYFESVCAYIIWICCVVSLSHLFRCLQLLTVACCSAHTGHHFIKVLTVC